MQLRSNRDLTTLLELFRLLALMLTLSSPAHALDPGKAFSQYAVTNWAHQNGLSASSVMAVAQTRDGFLWLATEQGLVRWDGVTMQTFDERNAVGLGDRFIRSLAADPDGSLWVGTMSGIARYHEGRFEDLRQKIGDREDVYDLCADGAGGVWFSSAWGLHHYLRGEHRVYTTADGLPANGITGLRRAADGTLWLGTIRGLVRFRDGHFSVYSDWDALRGSAINAIALGSKGSVWVGLTNGKVGRWSPDAVDGRIETTWQGEQTRGKPIESMQEDRDGTLWFATKRAGLGRLRGHALEIVGKNAGLPSDNPDWIFEDRENNLWIGFADAGLSMLRDTKFTTFGKAEGLSSDQVQSVARASDGGMLVGTADGGIDHVQGSVIRKVAVPEGTAAAGVQGLLQEPDGTLWIGTEAGKVIRERRGTMQQFRASNTLEPGVPSIVRDGSGQVWLALDMPQGLARWRNGQLEQVPVHGDPRTLAIAPDGALWIGAYQTGLIRWKDGRSRTYTEKDGLPSLALTSVYIDREGAAWAGTSLSGIVRVKDGRVTRYASAQGLFDDAVAGIIEDDCGYLWMAGSRGIWRVSEQELNGYAEGRLSAIHSESFGFADGLRSLQTSFAATPSISKSEDGRLWFATVAGLSVIDPARILINPALPLVSIESVLMNGKPMPGDRQDLRPPPGIGTVEISYAAPSFVVPEKVQFRYRLGGGDWTYVGGRRSANFRNLDPGSYRFEVQAASSDGVWSRAEAITNFTLVAHIYQTRWFQAMVGLCALLVVWCLYVTRIRVLKRRTEALETVVSTRTAELRVALATAESAKELLHEQATKDSLTGLWNRRTIFEILNAELERGLKEKRSCCVIMVDADRFKSVNDTYGHLAGDRIIQEIAIRLRRGLRHTEAVGRYGGEELLILLPDCPISVGVRRAEELRAAIEARPVAHEDKEIWITCSFGVAQSANSTSTPQIIGQADEALYRAKHEGRNCVRAMLGDSVPGALLEGAANVAVRPALGLPV